MPLVTRAPALMMAIGPNLTRMSLSWYGDSFILELRASLGFMSSSII